MVLQINRVLFKFKRQPWKETEVKRGKACELQEKGAVGRSRCEAFDLQGTGDTSHTNGCHWKGPETAPAPPPPSMQMPKTRGRSKVPAAGCSFAATKRLQGKNIQM